MLQQYQEADIKYTLVFTQPCPNHLDVPVSSRQVSIRIVTASHYETIIIWSVAKFKSKSRQIHVILDIHARKFLWLQKAHALPRLRR